MSLRMSFIKSFSSLVAEHSLAYVLSLHVMVGVVRLVQHVTIIRMTCHSVDCFEYGVLGGGSLSSWRSGGLRQGICAHSTNAGELMWWLMLSVHLGNGLDRRGVHNNFIKIVLKRHPLIYVGGGWDVNGAFL